MMLPPPPPSLVTVLQSEPKAQQSFRWGRESWTSAMSDEPEILRVLNRLPDRVDRYSTREVVNGELKGDAVVPAFVAAMVWGYGTMGYGPTRVRWVLTGIKGVAARTTPLLPTVTTRLASAVEEVRSNGPLAAFQFMNNAGRVKYLGSAFFTKWLYFASALSGPDDRSAAPILDQQVGRWLRDHAGIDLAIGKSVGYSTYLDLLCQWGEPHGRTAVQVEKAIFGLATRRA